MCIYTRGVAKDLREETVNEDGWNVEMWWWEPLEEAFCSRQGSSITKGFIYSYSSEITTKKRYFGALMEEEDKNNSQNEN